MIDYIYRLSKIKRPSENTNYNQMTIKAHSPNETCGNNQKLTFLIVSRSLSVYALIDMPLNISQFLKSE